MYVCLHTHIYIYLLCPCVAQARRHLPITWIYTTYSRLVCPRIAQADAALESNHLKAFS